jgi:LacI family transcriptional regulator
MAERSTIRDVAKVAGVSVKTVSRVLNDHPYVRAPMRAKVQAVMAQLAFRPSQAARSLAGAKSGQIALIYDNHSPYYIHQIQEGCWSRCAKAEVRLLAQPVNVADLGAAEAVRGLIAETHVDGIVLSSPVTDCQPILAVLEAANIPFVRISPGTNHALTSSVFMDDAQAGDDMATHLINLGHRQIAHIMGHANHMASDARLFGYRRALDRAGIPYDPQLVVPGEFDFDSGVAAAETLLALPNAPTAIFAANDDMAAGVLSVAHARGLDVPDQLSVAGFDDTTLARMVWPPLTTIRQPTRDLAYAATTLLLDQISGDAEAADRPMMHQRLSHDLVLRGSTAPPLSRSQTKERPAND